jgi:hypothetical protein
MWLLPRKYRLVRRANPVADVPLLLSAQPFVPKETKHRYSRAEAAEPAPPEGCPFQ